MSDAVSFLPKNTPDRGGVRAVCWHENSCETSIESRLMAFRMKNRRKFSAIRLAKRRFADIARAPANQGWRW
ncbi:hypothetical protein ACS0X5_03510 [Burkholderia gladioli]|uniref:hypothetical protein n=1 Tax=Burkholderia gladioli TaxID=28095 RepID=UPI0011D24B36|nr:hypothetical protein [Burkholderia gladioli]MBW5283031.1 hypothetical protein [Burkholderia gladioli]